jgi:nitroreductase
MPLSTMPVAHKTLFNWCFMTQSSLSAAMSTLEFPGQSAVDAAIVSRHSIRAYLDKPVAKSVIEDILRVSARAPSGTNTQPWKVYVLTGTEQQELSSKVLSVVRDPAQNALAKEAYNYYPDKWVSPYVDRRRKVGWDLYTLLGIGKADKEKMQIQAARNFKFFDAPVGLMFSIDRIMGQGSWLDYGMFLQNIMVAARGRGLDTCPQAAWNHYHTTISKHLGFAEDEVFVCGMSLGYADSKAIENSLITERENLESFTSFRGF